MRRVISLRVRVPVLSEAITDAEPNVSTECRFRMTAWRRASSRTPTARTSDRIAGRPSGTAATASDTPIRRMATRSATDSTPLIRASATITSTAMPITITPSVFETEAISFWSGESTPSVRSSMSAMAPTSVRIPVPVTTARPTPCTTAVPLKTMSKRSPTGASEPRVAGSLIVASDSPVSEASWSFRPVALSRRASAPTASPSDSTRMSPRTRAAEGTVARTPSRNTVELAAVMTASAATAFSALLSCAKPRAAFAMTMMAITMTSTGTPWAPSASHAISEITIATSSR